MSRTSGSRARRGAICGIVLATLLLTHTGVALAEMILEPPFTSCSTWRGGTGWYDNSKAACNQNTGAVSAWSSATVGSTTAESRIEATLDVPAPTTLQIQADLYRIGGRVTSGAARFSGTEIRAALGNPGDYVYTRETDHPFDLVTAMQIAAATIHIVAPFLPATTAAELVEAFAYGVSAAELTLGFLDAYVKQEAEQYHVSFSPHVSQPGPVTLYLGVRTTASGFFLGSASAFSAAQITRIVVENAGPPGPVAIAGPDTLVQDSTARYVFRVPDNREDVSIRVEWGDGQIDGWSEFMSGPDSLVLTHAYSDSGVATLRAWAKERDGLTSPAAQHSTRVRSARPDPVTGVAASDGASCSKVLVTWNPEPLAYSYDVYGDGSKLGSTWTTAYEDLWGTEGRSHGRQYSVVAHNDYGDADVSAQDHGYKKDRPNTPTNLTATIQSPPCRLKVAWTGDPDGDGNETDSYSVYRARTTNPNNWAKVATVSGRCSTCQVYDAPTDSGFLYIYRVTASNECGGRTSSNSDNVLWLNPGPPTPLAVAASKGSVCNQVHVNWTGTGPRFSVLRDGATIATGLTATYYDDPGLEPDVTHQYQVVACRSDCDVCSPVSASSTGWATGPPAAPINVRASDGTYCDHVHIAWENPAHSSYYDVKRDGEVIVTPWTSTEYDDPAVPDSLPHAYEIVAHNQYCPTQTAAAADSGHRGWYVLPPTNVSASDGAYCQMVTVSWDSVAFATGYSVWRDGAMIQRLAGLSYFDMDAAPGVEHTYRVCAHSECWMSDTSRSDVGYKDAPPQPTIDPSELLVAPEPPGATSLARFTFDHVGAPDPEGWVPVELTGRGQLGQLCRGDTLLQEGCLPRDDSYQWSFIGPRDSVDYACGGHADKAGVPYGIRSEIWSPPIGYVGVGSGDEVLLRFRVYADLDLQNLVFYVWHVRSLAAGHVGPWRDRGLVYYGDDRDWHDVTFPIGDLVEPDASAIQVALGVWDMRDVWYGVLGERDCHSQAPLFDDVEVLRLASQGPRWHARHFDLFQDVFATDSALTRTARADMAADITPRCGGIIPGIRPGDSVCVWVSDPAGLDFDPGGRLAAYAYVSLLPAGQSAKDGAQMQAAEMDGGQYRFPYLAPVDGHPGWHRFRMDQARDALDRLVPNRFCFDLKDDLFTAGDTVRYVLGARNRDAVESFWSRRLQGQGEDFVTNSLDEALASPCEFTVLPAGGWRHGGDILYVDHADDRNDSPADRIGDAFALLPYRDTTLAAAVDRYDVLGPSALVGNGPGSRLGAGQARLGDWYRRVVWDSGDLPAGTIGDGSGTPEKSDDFRLLYDFLEQTPDSVLVMVAGDDLNQEWAGLSGTWATRLRQDYAPWTLLSGNHWEAGATLPLTGVGGGFAGDVVTADAGCGGTARRDWDVFDPAPAAFDSVAYMYSGIGAAARRHIRLNGRSQRAWVVGMGLSLSDVVDTGDRAELLDRVLNQVPFLPVADVEPPRARADYLAQGYPNPARPSATIRFGLARRGPVSLKIYSVTGQLVRTLVNGMQEPAGDRALVWNGCDERGRPVASGVYFCRLVTQGMSRSHKLILLR